MNVFGCDFKNYYSKSLMNRLENGLVRKKVVYFSLWEDVGVFKGELKIE